MSSFVPRPVLTPRHFEITQNVRGYWVAKDQEGVIGGVFRTQKDALRFALFEVAGDSARVHMLPRGQYAISGSNARSRALSVTASSGARPH